MNRVLSPLLLSLVLVSCSSLPTFRTTDLPPEVRFTDRGDWLVLEPGSVPARETGLVFYPGGLVKPEAYLKALAPLAAAGFPVVVPKMPFDLAFFDADKGLAARKAVPGVRRWAAGGHSLGGVAASMAATKVPGAFAGLVYWASYPSESTDLSRSGLPVLSVSAANDGLATPAKVEAAARYLPPTAVRVVIEGGNHAQFGDYGPQNKDGTATLSRADQQAAAAAATLDFLEKLTPTP